MSQRIVWVVGAGFSQPLGGPLLGDLFTPASKGNLEARYPRARFPQLDDPAADLVRWLYRWGLAEEVSMGLSGWIRGERLWVNTEEFLDYLDTAVALGSESPGWRRLWPLIERYAASRSIPGNPPLSFVGPGQRQHVADTARRLLAAECSAFLPLITEGPPSFERWTPYQAWWRRVQPGQTIISFNYDLVVERLGMEEPHKLFVVPPGAKDMPADKVPLIKLHGSLNWRRMPGTGVPDRFETERGEEFALGCEDYELAIASPGLTKQRAVRDYFSALWTRAEEALAVADAVVFIGYRFPPTDSEALSRLLTAIGKNDNMYLALHTVLGPKRSDDVVRLHSLLRYAARAGGRTHVGYISSPSYPEDRTVRDQLEDSASEGERFYTLVSQDLWSQDFLLVAEPSELLEPYLIKWE